MGFGPLLWVALEESATDLVAQEITPALAAMGYDLVRVHLSGGAAPTLQIMAERRDGAAMTVEDCAVISRDVSALLDVSDPIPTAYTLEVSSPGIDRPLVREADYTRFAGFVARIETDAPVEGRRRFQGRMLGVEDGMVVVKTEKDTFRVPFPRIHKAKLVLTDDLIAATVPPAATN